MKHKWWPCYGEDITKRIYFNGRWWRRHVTAWGPCTSVELGHNGGYSALAYSLYEHNTQYW